MSEVGEKVKLRDKIPEDLARIASWSLDPETQRLDPPAGELFNYRDFSIVTLAGELVGTCTLYNHTVDEIQLGIRIGKLYWDKGYGTDAVNLSTSYAFFVMNVKRVWLKVLPQNTRAIHCYEKCGFVYAGKLALSGYDFTVMEIRIT